MTEQEKNCGNNCAECCEQEKCIPFFDHQDTMMHYNWVNRRSMISLIAVCVTMIIVVFIFATNQTKREQMWQDTIKQIMNQTTAAEVDDGQQDKNP